VVGLQSPLSFVTLNCDGIPADPESIKLENLVRIISSHHIIFLQETRTSQYDRLLQHLPRHSLLGHTRIPPRREGHKGFGVAIIAANIFQDYLSLLCISDQLQTIWVRAHAELFGRDRDVYLCASYVNPESQKTSPEQIDNLFFTLGEEIYQAYSQTPHILIGGDFNAHIANRRELSDVHYEFLSRFPHLTHYRQSQCSQVNRAGIRLLDLAANYKLLITTGHIHGDSGQRTFRGYDNHGNTRTDHFLCSIELFSLLQRAEITYPVCFDHAALSNFFMPSSSPTRHIDKRLQSPICNFLFPHNAKNFF